MIDLVLISAGAFGRELFGLANALAEREGRFRVKGFLDDRSGLLDGMDYPPILGSVDDYTPQPDDRFVCAIGDPAARKAYTERVLAQGGALLDLVHWTAMASERIDAGLGGNVVGPYCILTSEIEAAHSVHMSSHVVVGHDVKLGAYCQLHPFVFIGGGARIGEGVTLHPHAVVPAGARVGDWAVVGAGSVATLKVEPRTTVFGVPATPLPFPRRDGE